MSDDDQLLALVPGRRAIVSACEAKHHGDNSGCVCHLVGSQVVIGERYASVFVGTPTWHLDGWTQRVRLSEITFIKDST